MQFEQFQDTPNSSSSQPACEVHISRRRHRHHRLRSNPHRKGFYHRNGSEPSFEVAKDSSPLSLSSTELTTVIPPALAKTKGLLPVDESFSPSTIKTQELQQSRGLRSVRFNMEMTQERLFTSTELLQAVEEQKEELQEEENEQEQREPCTATSFTVSTSHKTSRPACLFARQISLALYYASIQQGEHTNDDEDDGEEQ